MTFAKTFAVGLSACVALAAPAALAVSVGAAAPGGGFGVNSFAAELSTAGAPPFVNAASFSLNERARLTFTAVAAESGFNNTFTVDGLGSLSETGDFGFGANLLTSTGLGSLSGIFEAGSLDLLFRFTTDGAAVIGAPLSASLGVYSAFGMGEYSTFFLAFDDGGAGPDADYDDFIVRLDVTAIPLPAAAWSFLVALVGLGLVGRRRGAA